MNKKNNQSFMLYLQRRFTNAITPLPGIKCLAHVMDVAFALLVEVRENFHYLFTADSN